LADKSTAESGGGSGGSELSPAGSIPKISSMDGRELGLVAPVGDAPVDEEPVDEEPVEDDE